MWLSLISSQYVSSVITDCLTLLRRADGTHPRIYLKREDLNHTGAHKIKNSLGQALLAKRMGKQRIIAETGAGKHGVATVGAIIPLICSDSLGPRPST